MYGEKGTRPMTDRMNAAEATGMAGEARMRVRVYVPCQASPAVWSPIFLGNGTTKHGRPRRLKVSHP
jgi:hypothetical protein